MGRGGSIKRVDSGRVRCGIEQRTDWWLPEGRRVGGLSENGEGTEKHRLVVTEQSRGCKVQRREHSQ